MFRANIYASSYKPFLPSAYSTKKRLPISFQTNFFFPSRAHTLYTPMRMLPLQELDKNMQALAVRWSSKMMKAVSEAREHGRAEVRSSDRELVNDSRRGGQLDESPAHLFAPFLAPEQRFSVQRQKRSCPRYFAGDEAMGLLCEIVVQ